MNLHVRTNIGELESVPAAASQNKATTGGFRAATSRIRATAVREWFSSALRSIRALGNHSLTVTSLSAVIAATVLAVPAALAQSPAAPDLAAPAQTVSMWRIVVDGIEWPAFLILFGSLAAMALIIDHFVTIRRATVAPVAQVKRARQLIERRKFRECLDALRKQPSFFGATLTAAMQHARHGFQAMHAAANEKSNELAGRMFRKVEYLNILGNLGPLMGLLGTVYGMIKAFAALSQGGGEAGADAGGLAEGISLALVNTLLGLLLAIVGLGFFGWCRNRVDNLTIAATVQVLDLLEYFRPAGSGSLSTAPSPPARPTAPLPPIAPATTRQP